MYCGGDGTVYNFVPVSITSPNMNEIDYKVWKQWGPTNFNIKILRQWPWS